ncbi:phosphoribosyltransferase [Corallococcus macrosporus]|uniref:Phosphoribosyl transferase domain-containing protein n=1 Tax=Myxococcus fulvus (strain ATCC BAA-855 / HW-1) TaxID=483219 RepID=F8CLQ0_MYXFH|nr:phosphoribosyltransferase [Corallococcus macrosporus]AEI67759.1 phosphoribosyl transferase domain-containing protein [Corallococcus macrosporus]
MQEPQFQDRYEGGRVLADHLRRHAGQPGPLVLALPRGGVPVAAEVARELGVPLDVFLVRKLGTPGHEELAMGAIASGGVRVLNREVVDELNIGREQLEATTRRESQELQRREQRYREGRPPPDVRGRTVILVDDGLATGTTMRAAVAALRIQGPAAIIVAVPVAPEETCESLGQVADEVVCVRTPEPFYSVGLWYRDFAQTEDDEVRALLAQAAREQQAPDAPQPSA